MNLGETDIETLLKEQDVFDFAMVKFLHIQLPIDLLMEKLH